MTRWLLIGVGCVALAGCSQPPERDKHEQSLDVASPPPAPGTSEANRAPGIDVTASPGVAFTYRYGFRLPSVRIAAVQEAHAQQCEKLGITRCRITGMRYRLLGENSIEAGLNFKLAPDLARGFGKSGIAVVEEARGTLIDAEITGTDAGAVVERSGADRARATDELRRLDARLAQPGRPAERAELQAQRAEAARQVAAATDTAADARASLATTPVTFSYGSGPAVRGFDTSAPITSAIDTAIGSAQLTLAALLTVLAVLGPPALALLLALLAWQRWVRPVRRRLFGAGRPYGPSGHPAQGE